MAERFFMYEVYHVALMYDRYVTYGDSFEFESLSSAQEYIMDHLFGRFFIFCDGDFVCYINTFMRDRVRDLNGNRTLIGGHIKPMNKNWEVWTDEDKA